MRLCVLRVLKEALSTRRIVLSAADQSAADEEARTLQLHLQATALTDSEMRIMWATFETSKPPVPVVRVHNATWSQTFGGSTTTYDVGLYGGWHGWIHDVVVS